MPIRARGRGYDTKDLKNAIIKLRRDNLSEVAALENRISDTIAARLDTIIAKFDLQSDLPSAVGDHTSKASRTSNIMPEKEEKIKAKEKVKKSIKQNKKLESTPIIVNSCSSETDEDLVKYNKLKTPIARRKKEKVKVEIVDYESDISMTEFDFSTTPLDRQGKPIRPYEPVRVPVSKLRDWNGEDVKDFIQQFKGIPNLGSFNVRALVSAGVEQ